MFHSYSGSSEMVRSLLKLDQKLSDRFYFGFSFAICGNRKNLKNVIAEIPSHKLLLESDLNDAKYAHDHLKNMCRIIAIEKNTKIQKMKKQLTKNLLNALD
jgi:Tat protein secretion system quality control protein TatD with DNase activity